MPSVAYAVASGTLIGVIRSWVIVRHQYLNVACRTRIRCSSASHYQHGLQIPPEEHLLPLLTRVSRPNGASRLHGTGVRFIIGMASTRSHGQEARCRRTGTTSSRYVPAGPLSTATFPCPLNSFFLRCWPSASRSSGGVVLFLSVLLVDAESLVSGRRVKGLREATAHWAAPDSVAASGTIGSEKTALPALVCLSWEPT